MFKASGMALTQREVSRRQLGSAAGEKSSVSLSLFMEVKNMRIAIGVCSYVHLGASGV